MTSKAGAVPPGSVGQDGERPRMRIALIGCGEISSDNAAGIGASRHCELGPVMDLDEEAARSLGSQFGVRYTASLEEVLEDPSVDAVVIAVPHYLHASICVQAAHAGKHVIVEKPLASTLADADLMIDECAKAGVALSVLFSFRYEPRVVRARQYVQAGALGDVVGTNIQFTTEKPASYWTQGYKGRGQSDWRGSWEKSGGGVLLMNTCHMLDYFRYVTGLEISRVYSELATLNSPVEVEDIISLTIRYEDGQIGGVQAASLARGERWRSDERIWGTHGTLVLAPDPQIYTMRRVENLKVARWQRFKALPKVNRIGEFFDRFAEAIWDGRPPEITGDDGRTNLAVVLGAYDAFRKGHAIELGSDTSPGGIKIEGPA